MKTSSNYSTPQGGYQENENAFPFILYEILEDAERLGFDDIISWAKNGKALQIYNREKLAERILPTYFSAQPKYRSFHRQLNLYNFVREEAARGETSTTTASAGGTYSHPDFLRGKRMLCHLITRQKQKPSTKISYSRNHLTKTNERVSLIVDKKGTSLQDIQYIYPFVTPSHTSSLSSYDSSHCLSMVTVEENQDDDHCSAMTGNTSFFPVEPNNVSSLEFGQRHGHCQTSFTEATVEDEFFHLLGHHCLDGQQVQLDIIQEIISTFT